MTKKRRKSKGGKRKERLSVLKDKQDVGRNIVGIPRDKNFNRKVDNGNDI